jgi:UDP-N-acetylmuramoyl-L-alanyl-D-glutamate--2,6-diaminopimelate ligase
MTAPTSRGAVADDGVGVRPRPLSELLPARPAGGGGGWHDVRITGITADSAEVREGFLFVAVRGTSVDGHTFVGDAVRRGAAAVAVEEVPPDDPGVPVVRVDDTRRTLAELAAAWFGHPARAMSLVGITGTVGKTSTLAMLESILVAAGRRVASLGSLGLRIGGETRGKTGYTAPEPLLLHRELARAAGAACELALMEVTSHALVQERVAGLRYDLGILTNLVPLEHQDYHGSFRSYVQAKRRFFDHVAPGAPLVYNADNPAARRLVHGHEVEPLGCGTSRRALARLESLELSHRGTWLVLSLRRPLTRLDGGEVEPGRIPLELRLLGSSNVANAGLAALAALCLGAEPATIQHALARFPPPRRRMEIIHRGRFTVLDDTVGHPDSISALFEAVERLGPEALHIAFAVRGRRGVRINRQTARALAIWCARLEPATLIVTRSAEAAGELDRVGEREHEAFCASLREAGIPFTAMDRLDEAVEGALERAGPGDLVLLLGAQGMDRGREVARRWLRSGRRRSPAR